MFIMLMFHYHLSLSGPQSPCERTDLRMAIVADHLGLSWTGESICIAPFPKNLFFVKYFISNGVLCGLETK